MNGSIKQLLRRQNKYYKKFRKNGYRNEGEKLADATTGQKTYWKILNKFRNKCNIPRIPPLFVNNMFITNCKEKATILNDYFTSQCTPLENGSVLLPLHYLTDIRLDGFEVTVDEIKEILIGLKVNKAHSPDDMSVNMINLCGPHLGFPLKMIFDNIHETGIFPNQ